MFGTARLAMKVVSGLVQTCEIEYLAKSLSNRDHVCHCFLQRPSRVQGKICEYQSANKHGYSSNERPACIFAEPGCY